VTHIQINCIQWCCTALTKTVIASWELAWVLAVLLHSNTVYWAVQGLLVYRVSLLYCCYCYCSAATCCLVHFWYYQHAQHRLQTQTLLTALLCASAASDPQLLLPLASWIGNSLCSAAAAAGVCGTTQQALSTWSADRSTHIARLCKRVDMCTVLVHLRVKCARHRALHDCDARRTVASKKRPHFGILLFSNDSCNCTPTRVLKPASQLL
jgi:hypothetical protein